MANFTLEDLERIVAIEQGTSHETARLQNGHETSRYRPPPERTVGQRIYDFLYKDQQWHSRADIAKALGLKKTNWLNGHIEQLVERGQLVKEMTTRPNGAAQFWYAVPR